MLPVIIYDPVLCLMLNAVFPSRPYDSWKPRSCLIVVFPVPGMAGAHPTDEVVCLRMKTADERGMDTYGWEEGRRLVLSDPLLLILLSFLHLFSLILVALPLPFHLPFCSLPFLLGNLIWSWAQPLLLISTTETVREKSGVLPHRALNWSSRGLSPVQVLLMTSRFIWDRGCNPSEP